jgi:hypothetical protein
MDIVFIFMVIALYALTHWLIRAIAQLGGAE